MILSVLFCKITATKRVITVQYTQKYLMARFLGNFITNSLKMPVGQGLSGVTVSQNALFKWLFWQY